MSRGVDLRGHIFGHLSVISLGSPGKKNTPVRWICLCDCGKTISVITYSLTSGTTKSCGCGKLKELYLRADLRGSPSCLDTCNGNRLGRARLCFKHRAIWTKHAITPQEHNKMIADQNGMCLLCSTPMGNDICIDHCHNTGLIRGLLHRACNLLVERYETQLDKLLLVPEYLLKTSQSSNGV